jgi:hypothetical protein
MSTENVPPGSNDPLVSPLGDAPAGGAPAGGGATAGGGSAEPSEPALGGAGAGGAPTQPAGQPTGRGNMLPGRRVRRSLPERLLVRLVATCGIVGIGVAIAAIMVSSNSKGWIVGLVVSVVSVILAAILWSARTL